jgi:hypothetical protein
MKDNRIAILLSGQSRHAYSQFLKNKFFFEKSNVDVFIHTWSTPFRVKIDNRSPGRANDRRVLCPSLFLNKLFKPKGMIVEAPISFYNPNLRMSDHQVLKPFPWARETGSDLNEFKLYLLNNNMSMWYSLSESFRLMSKYASQNNIHYKYIIRSRFDVFPKKQPKFEDIGISNYIIVEKKNLPNGMINDWFAIGDLKGMECYCNIFYKFDELYKMVIDKYNYWSNELGLRFSLENNSTQILFEDYELEWSKISAKQILKSYRNFI